MDAKVERLKEEFEKHLSRAAELAAEIQGLAQGDRVPHYDEIESAAHADGQRFSRLIQSRRAIEVAIKDLSRAHCPKCGGLCPVDTKTRSLLSVDGRLELSEKRVHCDKCRQSFFPSAE